MFRDGLRNVPFTWSFVLRSFPPTIFFLGGLYLFGKVVGHWLLPVFVALVAIAVVLVVLSDSLNARRHGRKLAAFADRYGWTFSKASRDYSSRFAAFPFDGTGESRQESVLHGTLNGVRCATFTHIRVVRDSDGQTVAPFQTYLVELPVVLPKLELVPETLAVRFAKTLGATDLDVESYQFNRAWRVICRDHRYAHAVLDPRMIERLLRPDALEIAIRIDGGAVMAWQPGREGTDTLARRLGVLTAVARRIPEHVVREYRERGATHVPGRERPIPDGAPDWATIPGALTSGKATGLEPGPAATGEGYDGLPWGDPRASFNIFDWGAGPPA